MFLFIYRNAVGREDYFASLSSQQFNFKTQGGRRSTALKSVCSSIIDTTNKYS